MVAAACAAAVVYRNYFFHLYQQNRSSEFKVKFKQGSNRCKKVLEAAKLAYAINAKESFTLTNLALKTFGELLIVLTGKYAIPALFSG